jgi:putative transcriptional regulator
VIGVALGPDGAADGLAPLFDRIGILDLHRHPDEVPGVEAVRLFAGYAGWTGGQLEGELTFGSWFVLEAEPDDVLTDDPEGLWGRVLARQEGLVGRVADYPEDPSMN